MSKSETWTTNSGASIKTIAKFLVHVVEHAANMCGATQSIKWHQQVELATLPTAARLDGKTTPASSRTVQQGGFKKRNRAPGGARSLNQEFAPQAELLMLRRTSYCMHSTKELICRTWIPQALIWGILCALYTQTQTSTRINRGKTEQQSFSYPTIRLHAPHTETSTRLNG